MQEIFIVLDAEVDIEIPPDKRIKLILNSGPRGANSARNTGIRLATSSVICLLDDDDYWFPNKIEKQLFRIDTKEIGDNWISWSQFIQISNNRFKIFNNRKLPLKKYRTGDSLESYLFEKSAFISGLGIIQCSTLMFSRKLGEKYPFDEKLQMHQDLCWVLNINQMDKTIHWDFVDEPLTIFKKSLVGTSSKISAIESEAVLHRYLETMSKREIGDYYLNTYMLLAIRRFDFLETRNAVIKSFRKGSPHFISIILAFFKIVYYSFKFALR